MIQAARFSRLHTHAKSTATLNHGSCVKLAWFLLLLLRLLLRAGAILHSQHPAAATPAPSDIPVLCGDRSR